MAFSTDEKQLYIVDSGITHGGPAHIRVFEVDGHKLRNGKVFADDFAPGLTDGIRLDLDGNVFLSRQGWYASSWSSEETAETAEIAEKMLLCDLCVLCGFFLSCPQRARRLPSHNR